VGDLLLDIADGPGGSILVTVDRGVPHPEIFSHGVFTLRAPADAHYVEVCVCVCVCVRVRVRVHVRVQGLCSQIIHIYSIYLTPGGLVYCVIRRRMAAGGRGSRVDK
jgi:hypothetical protein